MSTTQYPHPTDKNECIVVIYQTYNWNLVDHKTAYSFCLRSDQLFYCISLEKL